MCSPVDVSFPSDTALCNKECRLNLLCPNCILLPFSEDPLPLNPSPFPTKGSSLSIARCSRFDIVHKDDDSFGNVEDVFHYSFFKDLLLSRQMWSDKEISVPWLLMVYAVSLPIVLTSASSFLLAASALLNQTSLAPCLQPQLWESHEHGKVLVYINPSSQQVSYFLRKIQYQRPHAYSLICHKKGTWRNQLLNSCFASFYISEASLCFCRAWVPLAFEGIFCQSWCFSFSPSLLLLPISVFLLPSVLLPSKLPFPLPLQDHGSLCLLAAILYLPACLVWHLFTEGDGRIREVLP